MNRFILAAILPVIAAAPALAGNIAPVFNEPTPVVAITPTYSWSGAYVGAQLSYGRVQTDGLVGVDGEGALLGVRAGYDFDLGRSVVGALLQYDAGSIDLDPSGVEVENILRVGGRYGLDLGSTLAYASLGYARADTDVVGNTDGVFLGFGTETYVSQNLTLGVETVYHNFGDFDGAAGVDAEAVTLGVNLNFRF